MNNHNIKTLTLDIGDILLTNGCDKLREIKSANTGKLSVRIEHKHYSFMRDVCIT